LNTKAKIPKVEVMDKSPSEIAFIGKIRDLKILTSNKYESKSINKRIQGALE
jgi:hypothetical protein